MGVGGFGVSENRESGLATYTHMHTPTLLAAPPSFRSSFFLFSMAPFNQWVEVKRPRGWVHTGAAVASAF